LGIKHGPDGARTAAFIALKPGIGRHPRLHCAEAGAGWMPREAQQEGQSMSIAAVRISATLMGEGGLSTSRSFAFGHFVLEPERQLLLSHGKPVRIGGRALDLLTALVERAGELVDKDALVSCVWPTTFVDAANLKVTMASLRRALGESHTTPRYIATVVGRGYRFIAPVRPSTCLTEGRDGATAMAERIAGLIDTVEAIRLELQHIRAGSRLASPEEWAGSLRMPLPEELALDETTPCRYRDGMRAIVYP